MPGRWIRQFSLLVFLLGGAALLGLWFGGLAWWLVAALGLYLAHTLHKLYRLDRFLYGAKHLPAFEMRGLWAELFARVGRLKAKSRQRKKKYHRVLREVRESTGALRDGGIILNADHEIVWCNPAATRLLGLDPNTDVGHRIDNLIRHPDFVEYLAEPEGEGIIVPSPCAKNGWLNLQLIPYGRNQRIAIVRDITHEMHLERTRRDFVANASHELRSPLTVISGYLDTLADARELPDSWDVPVAEMLRQVDRMTRILQDLIELTRLETAANKAAFEFVDVAAMLEAIVKELQARRECPDITLRLESDAALLGNESELHSIFFNLVGNAVRFTAPSGQVEIVWRTDATGAVCEVSDTGIGIPADSIPRVTERFYRVDPGRSRASGGTGLGLAIVKHALQRHDARLDIASTEGVGSTFSCRFGQARVVGRGGRAAVV